MKKLKWIFLMLIIGYGILKWRDLQSTGRPVSTIENQVERGIKEEKVIPTENPREPEEEVSSEPVQEPETIQEVSSGTGSVTPEFKEAMDSYERFFDEYVEFMKKYSSSDDALAMLTDYSKYMITYAETMEKMEATNTDDLSAEDMAYYIDTMARIQKKLLEAAEY